MLAPGGVAGTHDDAVVAAGTGDNMGAALGLGLREGDVAISLGTSGTVFAVADSPTRRHRRSGRLRRRHRRFLPLVCTLNATKVTDAMARLLGRTPRRARAPGTRVRTRCRRRRAVAVLRRRTHSEPARRHRHVARPTLRHGACPTRPLLVRRRRCGLLDAFDALPDAGVTTDRGRVYVIGGGARSLVYPQLLADLLQRQVVVPAPAEYVARGACVQAAAALAGREVADVAREWAPPTGTCSIPTPPSTRPLCARHTAISRATHSSRPGDRR